MAAKMVQQRFHVWCRLECMNERFFSALWIYFMSFHFPFTPRDLALSGDPSIHLKPTPL